MYHILYVDSYGWDWDLNEPARGGRFIGTINDVADLPGALCLAHLDALVGGWGPGEAVATDSEHRRVDEDGRLMEGPAALCLRN